MHPDILRRSGRGRVACVNNHLIFITLKAAVQKYREMYNSMPSLTCKTDSAQKVINLVTRLT